MPLDAHAYTPAQMTAQADRHRSALAFSSTPFECRCAAEHLVNAYARELGNAHRRRIPDVWLTAARRQAELDRETE
jgi:hypothetical protein